jgi:hypothetical protein
MREIFDSSNEKNLTGRSIAAGSGLFSPSADGGMPEGKGVGVNMFNQKRKEVL